MIGVVSLLDDEHRLAYESLEAPPHKRASVPHLSYHVAGSYNWNGVTGALDEICGHFGPFDIVADAVAIFESIPAIVYLTVTDPEHLRALQQVVFERIARHSHAPDEYYTPQSWVPHITIASGIDPQEATKLAQSLRSKKIHWRIRIDNIAFMSVDRGNYIISNRTRLGETTK
ncbi:MAG: 2'-5' RNA ligase family protein [Candidatus Baltobacteraceae bacterium]